MQSFRLILVLFLSLFLAACGGKDTKVKQYRGPEVSQVQVHKGARKMYLLSKSGVLKAYDIGLGFSPTGHKQFEGDGKTPEGRYFIDYKNPNSRFHLSLKVSYPNPVDRSYAASHKRSPGGDIFVHGEPRGKVTVIDWTEGCIAVTNEEIREIYAMVRVGTPIYIIP